jgi:hypothetical protein
MLVLTLLLLMPSIPAIQQKTIEDNAYSDFVEKLKDTDLENIDLKLPETYGSDGDDVEIIISAGNFNKNIGFGVSIDVLNYKEESALINYSITRDRYFVKDLPETYENNFTVPPEEYWVVKIGVGNAFIIYNLKISAWSGEYMINREGISIGELVILK